MNSVKRVMLKLCPNVDKLITKEDVGCSYPADQKNIGDNIRKRMMVSKFQFLLSDIVKKSFGVLFDILC